MLVLGKMTRKRAPPFKKFTNALLGDGVWEVGSRCGVKFSKHKHHTKPERVYKRAGRTVSDSRFSCIEKRKVAQQVKRLKAAMAKGHVSGRRKKKNR